MEIKTTHKIKAVMQTRIIFLDENLSFKPFFENTDNLFGPSVGMKMKINF